MLAAARRARRFSLYFRVHPDTIRSAHVIDFLRHLLRQVRGRIELVWDRLGAHRSHETQAFLWRHRKRMGVHWLPAYSPDLNPDEYVWGHLKKNGLAHYCPDHRSQLQARLQQVVGQIQRRHNLLAAFVRAAGLSTDMDEGQ